MAECRILFRATLLLIMLSVTGISCAQQWALVKTAVTSLRTAPRHAAEMCTQAGMGTPIRLLQKEGSWWKVKLPDEYVGYVPANTIQILTQKQFDEWRKSSRIMVTDLETEIYNSEDVVSDLMSGNVLQYAMDANGNKHIANDRGLKSEHADRCYLLCLPDGRQGILDLDSFTDLPTAQFNADKIIATAKSMMGRVYLWGGTSPRMTDCSGLVKVCYLACGIILRRDASQQAMTGKTVNGITNAHKGDLLFFGTAAGKVNHVGIYIGNNQFIHCSGQVKINSLNPKDKNYIKYNLLKIKRIDGMIGTDGIWSIHDHPWYRLTD